MQYGAGRLGTCNDWSVYRYGCVYCSNNACYIVTSTTGYLANFTNGMKKLNIAFDVDDTLIVPSVVTGNRDVPNYPVIEVYRFFQAQGHNMYVWSGSGVDWATTWAEKLGLQPDGILVKEKITSLGEPDGVIDMCFDDCDVDLAKVNIKVKRVANGVSRSEWNKTKRP